MSRLTALGHCGLLTTPVVALVFMVHRRMAPERWSRSNLPKRTWVLSSLSWLKRWVWPRVAMVPPLWLKSLAAP
ncbi:hypothetical protein D9M68_846540 [compost metagenome]